MSGGGKRIFVVALAAVVWTLAACGRAGGKDSAQNKVVAASDDGISYPRNFRAAATLTNISTGRVVAKAFYDGADPTTTFGCSESSGGSEFVFYMKNGEEALKIDIQKPYFRESKSRYTHLMDVTLTGTALAASFDRSRQQYQLQSCSAELYRRGQEIHGTFSCEDVVPVASNDQHHFEFRFSCTIVPR